MKQGVNFPNEFRVSRVWRFTDFDIIYNKKFKFWWFFVGTDLEIHVDNRCFSTYDMCFRAARKWMKDHQNEIYG